MRGPFWSGKTGVTGEPNYRPEATDLHTYVDDNGKVVTLVGEKARQYLREHPGG